MRGISAGQRAGTSLSRGSSLRKCPACRQCFRLTQRCSLFSLKHHILTQRRFLMFQYYVSQVMLSVVFCLYALTGAETRLTHPKVHKRSAVYMLYRGACNTFHCPRRTEPVARLPDSLTQSLSKNCQECLIRCQVDHPYAAVESPPARGGDHGQLKQEVSRFSNMKTNMAYR